jgi:hypothetical protein
MFLGIRLVSDDEGFLRCQQCLFALPSDPLVIPEGYLYVWVGE